MKEKEQNVLGPGEPGAEVDLVGEVVDGEYVGEAEARGDIRWNQWRGMDSVNGRETTHFKLEVDESWYARTSPAEWEELNALALGLVRLQRRTAR